MTTVSTLDPLARAAVAAIHEGRVDDLRRLLEENPWLADARLGDDDPDGMSRTLLHVATDWPGHFPAVADTIRALVDAGADVDARFRGPHEETPLHWAASSDDTDALEALLDRGADIEARGAVIAGGTPLWDATAFAQWRAARMLVRRGAQARLSDLAALGMTDEMVARLDGTAPTKDEVDHAFWSACHGDQLATAKVLLERGADLDWVPPWEHATPLDIAARDGAHEVIQWLHGQGARTFDDLRD